MSASSRIRTCLDSDTQNICTRVLPDICGPCQKLLYLENHPRETISLFEKRQKLKELANYNHDRFIHRLPLEIASSIFELCKPDSRNLMDLDISHPDVTAIPFQLILSAVCRRWMAIAHSTPRLWTTVLLCTDPVSWPDPILVQTWLNRAGNIALSIRLCISNDLTYASWDAIDTMIDALNRYAGHWLQLKYGGPHIFLQKFIYEEQGKPQMRRLHIDISHPMFYTDLMTALKLRPKRLDALSISELKVTALNIDWQHLTELEIGSALSTDCFYVLSNAPFLVRCCLRDEPDNDVLPLPQKTLIHPSMQYLKITRPDNFPRDPALLYIEMLRVLSCPSLKTLILDGLGWHLAQMPLILEFLKRSGCALESLSLLKASLLASDITSLCNSPSMQTVYHIHIEQNYELVYSPGVLLGHLGEFITIDGRKEPRYFPSLRSLVFTEGAGRRTHLTFWKHWRLMPDILGSPIENSYSMQRHRHLLESVVICFCYTSHTDPYAEQPMDQHTLKRISWIKQAGVNWSMKRRFGTVEWDWDGTGLKSVAASQSIEYSTY